MSDVQVGNPDGFFRTAVCVLMPMTTVRVLVPDFGPAKEISREQKFLVISRRNDTTKWGLPGGKVDPGESNIKAVQRETVEETGMIGSVRPSTG